MDTPVLRFGYQSLTTPTSTYDYDMRTHQRTLLKRDEILGGFDPANYVTERLRISSRSEEHTSELQSQSNLVCRLLLEKKKKNEARRTIHDRTHTNYRRI